MAKKPHNEPAVCRNRKATHRFEILEKIECGIVLAGTEIKSVRNRDVSLEEAYARIEGNELWLIGCHIAAYQAGTTRAHEPTRKRKLLVHRRELTKLAQKTDTKGFTLVPLAIHFNKRGIAKLTLGVARGKSQADKRQDLKNRDHQREIERAMRRR